MKGEEEHSRPKRYYHGGFSFGASRHCLRAKVNTPLYLTSLSWCGKNTLNFSFPSDTIDQGISKIHVVDTPFDPEDTTATQVIVKVMAVCINYPEYVTTAYFNFCQANIFIFCSIYFVQIKENKKINIEISYI